MFQNGRDPVAVGYATENALRSASFEYPVYFAKSRANCPAPGSATTSGLPGFTPLPTWSTTGMRPSSDGRRCVPGVIGVQAGAAARVTAFGGGVMAGADELPPANSRKAMAATAPEMATTTARTQTEAERKTSSRETLYRAAVTHGRMTHSAANLGQPAWVRTNTPPALANAPVPWASVYRSHAWDVRANPEN